MPSADWARTAAAVWEIATPASPGRLQGVTMAGFRQCATDAVDLDLVPYPAVTLSVDLGDGQPLIEDADGGRQRGSIVLGLAPGSVRVGGRDIECLQLRLSPLVAHAVLGAGHELGGSLLALDDVWGRGAARIEERMRAAPSWDERFAIAEDELLRRVCDNRSVDPEVAFAWREMVVSGGQVRVEEVAGEIGWSRKRLWARFRSQVGLTPKRAAELVRFDHAAHRLAAGHGAAIAAAESGYADQSHLHRDAMTFAGVPPTAVAVAPWLAVDDVAWAATEYAARD
jgi:AraC-like DNA-binding protein